MLLASSGVSSSSSKTYIDDLFSAQLRTGTGSTTSIITGFQPDLIWTKSRSATTGHRLVDSTRGAGNSLESNSTLQQQSEATGITAFSSSGYSIGTDSDYNTSGAVYVDWCWKKAPKFFDVVTYTGNGVAGRQIPHSLGVAPGMVIVKKISDTGDWHVYHASLGTAQYMLMNSTSQALNFSVITAVSTSSITLPADDSTNGSGATYVAYLFAHDPSADGIIQCGSYTGTNPSISLGWEPQFVITKCVSFTSAYTGWGIFDSSRGLTVGNDSPLLANSSDAENGTYNSNSLTYLIPTATGFTVPASTTLAGGGGGETYIYLAIRRPNKPPTTGTQVYNAIARTGTGAAATVTGVGFAPDLVNVQKRVATAQAFWQDRLRGAKQIIYPSATAAESTDSVNVTDFLMDGFALGAGSASNNSGDTYINHFFRRAPGFFDVVCYTGTGVARTVPHGLGVAPELMIVKGRSTTFDWPVYAATLGNNKRLFLSGTTASGTDTWAWDSTTPTSTVFTVGADSRTNTSSATHVAYLFASLPGISKVGSYTGNGSSQTINCGFSAGARFILIKRTDNTGDWYVWDSVRGIVAANDPHLSLNTTAAEVTTDDSVDPNAIGFDVLQNTATNINVLNATYIYLAIA